MNVDDRMGSCRDKGRMWGRVGAWCLSWWQRDPVGTAWSKQVAPQPGQAQGPLIHSTPPLVPTGPWAASTSMAMIPRFGRQHSVGAQFIGAPPIYRPGERIDGPLADKSALCTINRHLRNGRLWSFRQGSLVKKRP